MVETKETTSENHTKSKDAPNKSEKHEKYSLWLTGAYTFCTFLLLIVAVATLIVSVYTVNQSVKIANESVSNAKNAYNLTNYSIQYEIEQQNSFNKHAAAEQFKIEIESMETLLNTYERIYSQGYDLTNNSFGVGLHINEKYLTYQINNKNGNQNAYYYVVYSGDTYNTLKYKTVPFEVFGHNYSKTLDYISGIVDSGRIVNTTVKTLEIPNPLYNDHGMYYLYAKDISDFNQTTSKNLYLFYNNITNAELNRAYLQSYIDRNNGNATNLNTQYFDSYMDMRFNIMQASKMIPTILEELNNETKN